MKALVLKEYNRLSYEEVARPEIGAEDVLVQVRSCGICGSDVHGMDGSTGRRQPPIIMGHEASGMIAEVGSAVTAWKVGERVTFDSTLYCGACMFCRRGQINLCDNRRVLGVSCSEYRRDGAFAEYVCVPERILYRLPENISFEHAAMVEALSIAFHAVGRTPLSRDDSAAVFGAGMIGLLLVQALRAAGCGRIFVVDIASERLELARRFGAHMAFHPAGTDPAAEVIRMTDGRGVDAAFEAAGITDTVEWAVQSVRKGGLVTLIGNISPEVRLPLQRTVTRELTLFGSCASSGEYPVCLEHLARGTVDVAPLISAVAPLSEGAAWFRRLYLKEKGLMKVVLVP